ncbi:MAG: lasso peptide biosynthesis B2 protein [Chromatiaceae bacterium]|nr:lasso peptide biosynthesis B2 protein [Chromatiaceae bacterium]
MRSLEGWERRVLVAAALRLPWFWVRLRLFGQRSFGAALVEGEPSARAVRSVGSAETVVPSLDELTRIGYLVNSAAHNVLPAGNCLTRSLCLQWLLRRRGVPTDLRIGVQLANGQLLAHAWVEYGGHPLNDTPDVAERYAPFGQKYTAKAWILRAPIGSAAVKS